MGSAQFDRLTRVVGAGLVVLISLAAPAIADFGEPAKPKIDCALPVNKNKPACKPKHGEASDEEIVNAAYWLSRDGHYGQALELLGYVAKKDDARALTLTGFVTRKLGDVDAALPLYARALDLKPDYVQAREYLGEAFLTKGDVHRASEQLGEIERRCGVTCVSYTKLKAEITAFEARQVRG